MIGFHTSDSVDSDALRCVLRWSLTNAFSCHSTLSILLVHYVHSYNVAWHREMTETLHHTDRMTYQNGPSHNSVFVVTLFLKFINLTQNNKIAKQKTNGTDSIECVNERMITVNVTHMLIFLCIGKKSEIKFDQIKIIILAYICLSGK